MRRALLALAILTTSTTTFAAGPIGVGTPIEGPSTPTTGLELGNRRAYWSRGEHRWFVSSIIDAGYLYLRPQIALGYGKPHWRFVLAETATTASAGGVGEYGGVRFALPFVEGRSGFRLQVPFARSFLTQQASYDRYDLEDRLAPSARYTALDAELLLTIPVIRGSAFALLGVHRLFGVPAGYDVYEEQLRVVARAPWIYRARIGYALRLGEQGAIRIGPVVDVVHVPGRSATIIRGGVIATVVLTHHVEVLATVIPTFVGPDRIGVAGGDFAQLGIRYRWATPEPPHAP